MKIIRLYGDLAQKFGKEFRFDVRTPAEAVRAMCVTVAGFEAYLRKHKDDAFKIFAAGRNVSESLRDPMSDNEVIRIAPVIQGASAVGRIILGAVLLVASLFVPGGWAMASQISAGLMGMGASMILGGVVQLLSPTQSVSSGSGESTENMPSYNFNGPVNTTAQGHPVPLAYGRIMAGSAVISAGYTTR